MPLSEVPSKVKMRTADFFYPPSSPLPTFKNLLSATILICGRSSKTPESFHVSTINAHFPTYHTGPGFEAPTYANRC